MKTKFYGSPDHSLLIDTLLFAVCLGTLWQLHRAEYWPLPILVLLATAYGFIKHKNELKEYDIGGRLMKGGALFMMISVWGYFIGEARSAQISESEAIGLLLVSAGVCFAGYLLRKNIK